MPWTVRRRGIGERPGDERSRIKTVRSVSVDLEGLKKTQNCNHEGEVVGSDPVRAGTVLTRVV